MKPPQPPLPPQQQLQPQQPQQPPQLEEPPQQLPQQLLRQVTYSLIKDVQRLFKKKSLFKNRPQLKNWEFYLESSMP